MKELCFITIVCLIPYVVVARSYDNTAPAHKGNLVFYLSLKFSRNIVAKLLVCKPRIDIKSLFFMLLC